uniref:Uncharacterized protein n=1 Tax=Lepeophtheirus salmonis TaxID=72036 RepID=A0A0K2V732_LEPSM
MILSPIEIILLDLGSSLNMISYSLNLSTSQLKETSSYCFAMIVSS